MTPKQKEKKKRNKLIKKDYKRLCKDNKGIVAVILLAEKYKISEPTVWRAITF